MDIKNKKTVNRFEELDLLRFFAAFLVVLFHYSFRIWNEDGSGSLQFGFLSVISQYGYLGVDAFFLISGFVILMSADNRSCTGFSISRIVRLYPAYWFCTLLFFAVNLVFFSNKVDMLTYLVNLTMLQSWLGFKDINSVYWTLIIELQFYLFIGFLLATKLQRFFEHFLWIWLLLCVAVFYIQVPAFVNKIILSPWAHYFIAGSCFYLIWKHGLTLLRFAMLIICLVQATKLAYWYMLLKEKLTGVSYEFVVVSVFLLLLFALFFVISTKKLKTSFGIWTKLGSLTYPLYLLHPLGYPFLKADIELHQNIKLIIALVVALIASYMVNKYIEKRYSLNLKIFIEKLLLGRSNQNKQA